MIPAAVVFVWENLNPFLPVAAEEIQHRLLPEIPLPGRRDPRRRTTGHTRHHDRANPRLAGHPRPPGSLRPDPGLRRRQSQKAGSKLQRLSQYPFFLLSIPCITTGQNLRSLRIPRGAGPRPAAASQAASFGCGYAALWGRLSTLSTCRPEQWRAGFSPRGALAPRRAIYAGTPSEAPSLGPAAPHAARPRAMLVACSRSRSTLS